MSIALLAASLTLAAVFALAGAAKLADRAGTRRAAEDFGVPTRFAGPVGMGVAVAELVVAGLLLPAATRSWAAVAALALLFAFSGAIGLALARGRAPECHCFGRLHSAPAGWGTLARNAVLAGLAAFVAVAGREDAGPGALAWAGRLDAVGWVVVGLVAALLVTVAAGGVVVLHLLRGHGRLLVRLERVEERLRAAGLELDEPDAMPQLGLAPGTRAPAFWLADTEGSRVALGDLLEPGRPLLLLFTSPTCGPCAMLMPEVARWQREQAGELTVALVSDGDPEAVRAHARQHGLANVLLDEKHAIYGAYEANGTPSAVLVADDGTIASWLAAGADWIETLVEQALDGLGRTPGLPVGTLLPPLRLTGLDGAERELAELVDGPTVLLFWNPGCGFCRAMHEDLLAWERERPVAAPALVVVSAGNADDVRAEELSSPVLLDPEWEVATALGAGGTPMGLLLDGERTIASSPVVGAEAVLDLLGARRLSGAR